MSHLVEDAIASQVKDVMTTEVSMVRLGTPYKAIAAQLHEQRAGAFPVVDKDGYVVGVVSAADLLAKPAALAVRSRHFRAHRPAGKESFALADDVAVDPVGRRDFRCAG